MKVLNKIIPYKIRRALPILGIAAGSMFMSSCSNDEPDVPMHDTTYTWGYDNFRDPQLPAKIRASADSASVRNIILKSDGVSWGSAYNENEIRYLIVEPLIQAGGEQNRHKFKGTGTIKHINIESPIDNQWLTDFGYDIIPSTLPSYTNAQNQR